MDWVAQLTTLLLSGVLAGFLIAAPVGPIGILCIKRSLHHHFILAFLTGVGAGLADTFYGAVACFGLASIASLLHEYDPLIRFVGGGALIAVGFKVMRDHHHLKNDVNNESQAYFKALTSAFFLTLANPATLIAFTAAFATLGLNSLNRSAFQAGTVVLGVFLGATMWWLVLSSGVYLLRKKLNDDALTWINRVSGTALIVFAVYLLWTSHYLI
ncbi:LysE family transporter [Candidatus Bealeia paramacronuclearis]|uniref:LysE family transporter n=1 Tax=Candidatus Bealeia paramacronuclearis TaxID=1921001 RepID=A0ABZ2C4D7_9PROT|nr:LysE family transporter [Candidatus Bealeia paramacronuclearis]